MATNKVNTLEKPAHEALVSRQEVKPQPSHSQKRPPEIQHTNPSQFKKGNTAGQSLEDLETKEADFEMAKAEVSQSKNIPPEDANIHMAVDLIKTSKMLSKNTKEVLTPDLVKGIYAAEDKRLSWYERIGIDGDTVGRGQIGKDAYEHVEKKFPEELKKYMHQLNVNRLAEGKKFIQLDGDYEDNLDHPEVEDFFTPAYLAISINASQKEGRIQEDALKFGIGRYHGGFGMMSKIQKQMPPEEKIHYEPVKNRLLKGGERQKDLVKYISEVMSFRN